MPTRLREETNNDDDDEAEEDRLKRRRVSSGSFSPDGSDSEEDTASSDEETAANDDTQGKADPGAPKALFSTSPKSPNQRKTNNEKEQTSSANRELAVIEASPAFASIAKTAASPSNAPDTALSTPNNDNQEDAEEEEAETPLEDTTTTAVKEDYDDDDGTPSKSPYQIAQLIVMDLPSQNAITAKIAAQNLTQNLRVATYEKCHELYRAGAVAVLLIAMNQHSRDEVIQSEGCLALGYLMHQCAPEIKDVCVQIGGLTAILTALESFPEDPQVQRCGIFAISIFFGKHEVAEEKDTDSENANNVVKAKKSKRNKQQKKLAKQQKKEVVKRYFVDDNHSTGVQLLLTAMKTFPEDEQLQTTCIGILVDLRKFQKKVCRIVYRTQGAITAVATATEMHSDNKHVQKMAKKFMKMVF